MVRTVSQRDATPAWRASLVGMGIVVVMTGVLAVVGWLVAFGVQVVT